MSYRTETLTDTNRDGVWDTKVTTDVQENYYGTIDYERSEVDNGNDSVVDKIIIVDNIYTDSGLFYQEYRGEDNNVDGVYEVSSWRVVTHDSLNRVSSESTYSDDWNQNGLPDYTSVMTVAYEGSGRVSTKETYFYYDNTLVESDYRLETYTYNSKGLLAELKIDDWSIYDFEIGFKYSYNTFGQLTKVEYRDEFVFGDNNYHVEEKYFYNKNGSLKESNKYNEFFTYTDPALSGDHVLEVKTKFSYYGDGKLKSELKVGAAFTTWNTVDKQLTEHWYDANGRETDRLTSYDMNLDGVWDAGTRTLERFAYDANGTLIMNSVDYNTGDGHLEYLFTHTDSQLLLG